MTTTRSTLIAVVVERDLEEAPDDPNAWNVVRASLAPMPATLGAGYAHGPDCFCRDESAARLCDVGWLEECEPHEMCLPHAMAAKGIADAMGFHLHTEAAAL